MAQTPPETPLSDLGEGLSDIWTCGFRAWRDYLGELAMVRGVDDLMRAQTRLYLKSCGVIGEATGEMLRRHGVTTPTLNEP